MHIMPASPIFALHFLGTFLKSAQAIDYRGTRRGISTSKWIDDFNAVLTSNPALSLASFLAMRSSCWYAFFGVYAWSGCFPGSELAIGYILAKFTGKLRQPANIALAGFISKVFPVLTKVKSGPLLGIVVPMGREVESAKQPNTWMKRFQEMFDSIVVGPVDTYGFSLYLAGKINVSLTVIIAAICIRYGLDANSILSSFGISETIQSGGSAMGAATVSNMLLLPLQLRFLPQLANFVANTTARYDPKHQQK